MMISSCWGVLVYVIRTDRWTDICDCRVAFATEKILHWEYVGSSSVGFEGLTVSNLQVKLCSFIKGLNILFRLPSICIFCSTQWHFYPLWLSFVLDISTTGLSRKRKHWRIWQKFICKKIKTSLLNDTHKDHTE